MSVVLANETTNRINQKLRRKKENEVREPGYHLKVEQESQEIRQGAEEMSHHLSENQDLRNNRDSQLEQQVERLKI